MDTFCPGTTSCPPLGHLLALSLQGPCWSQDCLKGRKPLKKEKCQGKREPSFLAPSKSLSFLIPATTLGHVWADLPLAAPPPPSGAPFLSPQNPFTLTRLSIQFRGTPRFQDDSGMDRCFSVLRDTEKGRLGAVTRGFLCPQNQKHLRSCEKHGCLGLMCPQRLVFFFFLEGGTG